LALRWIDAAAAAAMVLSVAFLILPLDRPDTAGRVVVAIVPSAVAVGFAIAIRVLARLLLARPQPTGDDLVVATDDTVRSAGIRAVLAAGVVVVASSLVTEMLALGLTDVTVLRWGAWVPALALAVLAYRAWRALVEPGRWPVRRHVPRPSPA